MSTFTNLLKTGLISMFFILLTSCETVEIKPYTNRDSIYFSYTERYTTIGDDISINTYPFSFALEKKNTVKRVFKLPISVLGNTSTEKRKVNLVIDSSSTAIEKVHYDIPSPVFISPNLAVDSIPITLHKTPEMIKQSFKLVLKLEPNEFFKTDFQTKIRTNDTLSRIKATILIDNIIKKPDTWDSFEFYYFGDFSVKKFFLMRDVLDFDAKAFYSGKIPFNKIFYYAAFMKNYLNKKKKAGETVYEESGAEMTMGEYA